MSVTIKQPQNKTISVRKIKRIEAFNNIVIIHMDDNKMLMGTEIKFYPLDEIAVITLN